jgi:hypothetical protein
VTLQELLHDIVRYGDFKGGIDLDEAHKAIDDYFGEATPAGTINDPSLPETSATVASPETVTV